MMHGNKSFNTKEHAVCESGKICGKNEPKSVLNMGSFSEKHGHFLQSG
jgi:hypothetical protein